MINGWGDGDEIGWINVARWAPPCEVPARQTKQQRETGRSGAALDGGRGEPVGGPPLPQEGGRDRIGAASPSGKQRPELMRGHTQVNPQLKGHLRGALNGGASVEQVRAVRHVSIQVCRASGMRLLTADDPPGCWGWRAEVQDL